MALISEQPPSASTSPALSPCHSNSSQGSPSNAQKRPTPSIADEHEQPQSKKQRIAHIRKPDTHSEASSSPKSNGYNNPPPNTAHPTHKREAHVSDSSLVAKDKYSPKGEYTYQSFSLQKISISFASIGVSHRNPYTSILNQLSIPVRYPRFEDGPQA